MLILLHQMFKKRSALTEALKRFRPASVCSLWLTTANLCTLLLILVYQNFNRCLLRKMVS